jgi:methylmalonyl-CoA/ethylmalonyl-CoA epimerase
MLYEKRPGISSRCGAKKYHTGGIVMDKTAAIQKLFSNLEHVGIVVADVDKTAAEYQALGMGQFEPQHTDGQRQRWVRGTFVEDYKLKIMLGRVGPIKLELLEPVSGKESIHKEFIETTGGGLHHLAFAVDDIDEAEREMARAGYEQIFKSRRKGGGAGYFKSDRPDAVLIELLQRPRS